MSLPTGRAPIRLKDDGPWRDLLVIVLGRAGPFFHRDLSQGKSLLFDLLMRLF